MLVNSDIQYVKSKHIESVSENNNIVIWHSLFGNPKIISSETLEFLDEFLQPGTIQSKFKYNLSNDEIETINELIDSYYLVELGFDERKFLKNQMHGMISGVASGSKINYLELIMSEVCNFRCTYCIHFNNLEMHDRFNDSEKFMDFDTAKKAIDLYLQILKSNENNIAEINFGGGEPLMAWDVIENVLKYCKDNFSNNFEFRYSINTNASLIDFSIAKILKEYKFSIATSLDGMKSANDKVRITKRGDGTFEKIIKGFDVMDNVNYPIDGFAVTINEDNFYLINESIIDWAVNRNMTNVRLDIDILGTSKIPINEVIEKFLNIRKYAKSLNIEVPGFWLRPAENLNSATYEKHTAFCGATRGNSMCVSPSGNIYSCGYSSECIGSVYELGAKHFPNAIYVDFVVSRFTGNIEMCKGCIIEGQCNGGCNITREFSSDSTNSTFNRMCEFYRGVTKKILLELLHESIDN